MIYCYHLSCGWVVLWRAGSVIKQLSSNSALLDVMSRISDLRDEEIKELLNDKDAKRTLKANEQCWRVFKNYCGGGGEA